MTTAVRLEGLRKTYANGTEALKGIDLKVDPCLAGAQELGQGGSVRPRPGSWSPGR